MTLRCIIWAAVSTPQQAEDSKESIPAQVEQARQAIAQKGWQEVGSPLVVPGQSRNINWLDQAMKEIPAMQELISLADAKKIDLVIVRDWDRLARTESLRVQISTRLREQGVQVYSVNQPVEPQENFQGQSDTALIVEGMSGIMGEMENRLRARRHRMGMKARCKRGLWPGTGEPFGYTYDKAKGLLIIKKDEAQIVKQIFKWAREGKSTYRIAQQLNSSQIPSPGGNPYWTRISVFIVLRRPTYAGYIPYAGQLYEGQHAGILDRAEWEEVQRRLKARGKMGGRAVASPALLSGLLRCGYCRQSMQARKDGKNLYYRCELHQMTGLTHCRSNHHPESALVSSLMRHLATYTQDDALDEPMKEARQRDSESLKQERLAILKDLSEMEARKTRQFVAYERGQISLNEYAQHRDRLAAAEDNLKDRLAAVERSLASSFALAQRKHAIQDVLQNVANLPSQSLKQELAALLEILYVYEDGALEVRFRG